MARVSINQGAFFDPRLIVAGRVMRMSPAALGWKLAFAWSRVTNEGTAHMSAELVAACIGKKTELVHQGLTHVNLAIALDGEVLDLSPMRALFGDFEWLSELRDTSSDGGKARASRAERGDDGRFVSRDLRQELIELLADARPRRRTEIVGTLQARKASLYQHVRQLLSEDLLTELDDGRVTLTSCTRIGSGVDCPESRNRFHGSPRNPAPSSALTPALALASSPAPALASEGELARTSARVRELRDPEPEEPDAGTETAESSMLAMGTAGIALARADRFGALYEHWDSTGRDACGDEWRSCGPVAGRHRVREALNHPELVQRSDDELMHGLSMLNAECIERARLGEVNPWRWYRNAWSPRVLSIACDVPNVNAARARVSGSSESTEKRPHWLDEINEQLAAEECERAG